MTVSLTIALRLPRNMLQVLVPEGSTLDRAWAVLLGDREQVSTHTGRPVYASTITSWHLVQVVGDESDARHFAEDLGAASLGGVEVDQWNWYPTEGDGLVELYGVEHAVETPADMAIVPLTALLADEPTQSTDKYRPEQTAPTFDRIPRESA